MRLRLRLLMVLRFTRRLVKLTKQLLQKLTKLSVPTMQLSTRKV